MKALTISQPFAELIANGEKWVENRTWGTGYRGPLAIHAGKGTQYLTASELRRYDRGCFVAVCDLMGCVPLEVMRRSGRCSFVRKSMRTVGELLAHPHTEGPVCWILANVRRIATVAYRGQTGLFDVPDELIAEALAAERNAGSSSLLPPFPPVR